MMHLLLIATLAAAVRSQIVYNPDAVPKQADQLKFLSYTALFGKSYSDSAEYNERIRYYMAVDEFINNYDELDVELAHNKFSDWSPEEKQKVLGRRSQSRRLDVIDDAVAEQTERHLAARELQSTNTTCTNNGFFLTACNYGCKTCKNATTCLECWTKNFNLTRGSCSCATKQVNDNVTECFYCTGATFWHSTQKKCVNCSTGCAKCTSGSSCTTCNTNWTKLANNSCSCASGNINLNTQQCVTCASKQYFDGSKCLNCPANCTTCTKLTGVCTACTAPFTVQSKTNTCGCSPGFIYDKTTNKCVAEIVTCPTGQFWNSTLRQCVYCSWGCATCVNETTCKTCLPSWTKYQYIDWCYCATGNIDYNTDDCITCKSNQFFDGEVCQSCPDNCTTCSKYYGVCSACTAPFTVQSSTNTCGCSAGFIYDKTTNKCVTQTNCTAGNFVQQNNTCAPCGQNCTSCEQFTGKCLTCASNNTVNWKNDKECIYSDCYKVGPVGNQTVCLETAFNATRIVAPFNANATSFDWRTIPIIWGIQDQGSCGSCYAFSAIVSYESAWAIKTGNLYKLSEQHIVDCDTSNYGCDGGWQDYAVKFLAKNGAILASDYKYTSGTSGLEGTCKEKGLSRPFRSAEPSYYYVKSNKDSFKDALRQQPLIVSFAVGDEFYYVKTGIYTGTKCSTNMNHAMTAVAYGIENGVEYVVIQNQWGTSWGDKGYVKVALTSTTTGVCQLYSDNYVVLV